uniref:Ig-like domain-containing protein n=1 Tax=Varanus komodoensis TaxID=61221 RepID=A0A8D2IZG5_VARKO
QSSGILAGGLLVLPGSLVSHGSSAHTLLYFYTGVSEPGPGLPRFVAVGYLDDQLFLQYDRRTGRALPRVPWAEEVSKEDTRYWQWMTQNFRDTERTFGVALVTVPQRHNQSGGFHTFQWRVGCELRSDGSKGGYSKFGYDGRDYISLDMETLTWTAHDPAAQNAKRLWDANAARNRYFKTYLEEVCTMWLRRHLAYGNETLLRAKPPVGKVTRRAGGNGTETLLCRAHGFHPKEIDAVWTRDGEVWAQDTFRGIVAPNADGTYYTWLSVRVDPRDRRRFRCHIEHDGLRHPLDLAWEEPGGERRLLPGGGRGGERSPRKARPAQLPPTLGSQHVGLPFQYFVLLCPAQPPPRPAAPQVLTWHPGVGWRH